MVPGFPLRYGGRGMAGRTLNGEEYPVRGRAGDMCGGGVGARRMFRFIQPMGL